MNWLENDKLVQRELLPIIKEDIKNWIDDNRYEDWFESINDVEEFSEEPVPDELYELIENNLYEAVEEYGDDYNELGIIYEYALDDILLENLIFENWDNIKSKYVEKLYEKFNSEYSVYANDDYDY